MQDYKILPGSIAHIDAIVALHGRCFAQSWSADAFTQHLDMPADKIDGLFIKGKLCGFILTRFAIDQAEILTLAIAPEHRRAGLALTLLHHAETTLKAQGADIIFLEVAEDNPAALALYSHTGYHLIGHRPGYYKRATGKVGARILQKRL